MFLQSSISKMLHALMLIQKWTCNFQERNIYFSGYLYRLMHFCPYEDNLSFKCGFIMYCFSVCCKSVWLSCSQLFSRPVLNLSFICLTFILSLSPPWSTVTSSTAVSLWSFVKIAKEKFNMPLRDNYQTVKLPHSSSWVITFPLISSLSPPPWNETISF